MIHQNFIENEKEKILNMEPIDRFKYFEKAAKRIEKDLMTISCFKDYVEDSYNEKKQFQKLYESLDTLTNIFIKFSIPGTMKSIYTRIEKYGDHYAIKNIPAGGIKEDEEI